MSDTFNFGRFLKYFRYDISNAKDYYGLSILIWGCLPIILYVIAQLFSLLILRQGLVDFNAETNFAILLVSWIGITLTFPAKVYGQITEKKYGSNWIMIPASALEKTISMILIGCVIVPLCFAVLFLANSGILSLVNSHPVLFDYSSWDIFKNPTGIFFLNWAQCILFYILGALIFKKRKAAKTLLCNFALIFLLLILTLLIFGKTSITNEELHDLFDRMDSSKMEFWINFIINAIYILWFAVMSVCIYFRVKTIKH